MEASKHSFHPSCLKKAGIHHPFFFNCTFRGFLSNEILYCWLAAHRLSKKNNAIVDYWLFPWDPLEGRVREEGKAQCFLFSWITHNVKGKPCSHWYQWANTIMQCWDKTKSGPRCCCFDKFLTASVHRTMNGLNGFAILLTCWTAICLFASH